MSVVEFGPNAKRVEIPDEMLAQFDAGKLNRGGLADYIVRTQQATPEELGLGPNAKPEVSGPFQAAMINAGREVNRLGSNIGQLAAQVGGDQAGVDAELAKQAEMDRLAAPVREQYPKASFAGEVLPGFAVPGGKFVQMGVGGALGALEGDTPGQRLANAALGIFASFLGQKAGDEIASRVVPKIQGMFGSALSSARGTLAREGIPTTLGQRGSHLGRFVDVLRSTLTRRQPLEGAQIRGLNRLAAEAIGEKADDLSKPVLSRAAARIGEVYEQVAKTVGSIAIGPDDAARLAGIDDMLRAVPEPSKAAGAIAMVEEMLTNPKKAGLTGESYNAVRQRLGRISNQLWNQGSGLEAEVVDELIDTLDDALARSAPEAAEGLAQVRPQWRFLRALRKGAALDESGNINPRAMNAAMESVYKGFDIGQIPEGAAGRFGTTLDAFNQVVKPFKSSGTAERVTQIALPALAALGLTGAVGTGGGVALAAPLALALLGGGAGGAAGGNLARTGALQAAPLTNELARRLQQGE